MRKKLCAALLAGVLCVSGALTGYAAVNETASEKAIREANIESVRTYTESAFAPVMTTATYEQFQEYIDAGQILVSFLFDNDFSCRWKTFFEAHGDVIETAVDEVEVLSDGYSARIILTGTDEGQMALTVNYDSSLRPISTSLAEYSKEAAELEKANKEAIRKANLEDVEVYTEGIFVALFMNFSYEQYKEYADQGQFLVNMVFDNDLGYRWKQFYDLHGNVTMAEVATSDEIAGGYTCTLTLTGEDGEKMSLTIEYDRVLMPVATSLGEYVEFENDVDSGVESVVESAYDNVEEVAAVPEAEEVAFAYDVTSVEDLTVTHYADIAIENYGTITVALDETKAPITVRNFVALAQAGFYDGLKFHRIIDGFMMQGGDPLGNGTGGSDEEIKGEFYSNGVENPISHVRGAISMARSMMPDSASSQFFIVQSDSTFLDGEYAAFGFVTEGIEIVDAICSDAQPTDDNGSIEASAMPVMTSVVIRAAE